MGISMNGRSTPQVAEDYDVIDRDNNEPAMIDPPRPLAGTPGDPDGVLAGLDNAEVRAARRNAAAEIGAALSAHGFLPLPVHVVRQMDDLRTRAEVAEKAHELLRRRLAKMSEASDVVAVDTTHARGVVYVSENGRRQLQAWDDAEGETFEDLAPLPGTRAALAREG